MKNTKKTVLITVIIILLSALIWAIFGSLKVTTKIGEQCGLEQVAPCIMYDITGQKDILAEYRTVFIGTISVLIVIAALALMLHISRRK